MKTHLIHIGNSRGVRLPKPLIAQAGLTEEVELRVTDGAIIIARTRVPRDGWAEAARNMPAAEKALLDAPTPTKFDKTVWTW
jgi:antitoxin MazE